MDPEKAKSLVDRELKHLKVWTAELDLDSFVSERLVIRDEPSQAIASFVRHELGGVMLLGTHAARGFERLLLGSVAEEIVRDAPGLIVGPRSSDDFRKLSKFRRVLFATDLSPFSFFAIKVLRDLQRATATEVYVLHVLQDAPFDPALRHALRMEVTKTIEDQLSGVELASIAIESGIIPAVITRFAEEFDVDAVVLGVRHGNEFTRAETHLRSLTSKIISEAPCPIFAIASRAS